MSGEETQFRILERVGVGGMAEIFRARNEKTGEIVAIKRILPALGRQPEFVNMFVDEAVVCMGLVHPNIVRVYQFGMMGEDMFLSMAYVDGINLQDLLNFSNKYDFFLPAHEAMRIAIAVLDGLDYAHGYRDDAGKVLSIVHRDVSPPNILLGCDGSVKLTDFGLVKAKTQMTRTVPGLIKGKFSYLSPEAAYGESVDVRSDVYAVGIILWEMLTARPLFVHPVEMKILELVRKSIVPAISPINASVPPELEAIVRRGLARNREERYQTARAFADALRALYVAMESPASTMGQIVSAIRSTPAEGVEDGAEARSKPPEVEEAFSSEVAEENEARESVAGESASCVESELDSGAEGVSDHEEGGEDGLGKLGNVRWGWVGGLWRGRSRRLSVVIGIAVVLGLALLMVWMLR